MGARLLFLIFAGCLANQDPHGARTLAIELRGVDPVRASGRILTGDAMDAHNTFDAPNRVTPTDFDDDRLRGSTVMVDLPARSVLALELTVAP